jgi:hypothetical protein
MRVAWFKWRKPYLDYVLFDQFLYVFANNLEVLLHGGKTGFAPAAPLEVAQSTTANATTISVRHTDNSTVDAYSELASIAPGQIAMLGGDRPVAALVLAWDFGPPTIINKKARPNVRLKVAPLQVSIAAGSDTKGTPGLVPAGTALTNKSNGLKSADLKFGEDEKKPELDGPIQEAVALSTQLQLIIPRGRRAKWTDRLEVAAPYPDVDHAKGIALRVAAPVSTQDSTLTIVDAPGVDDPSKPMVARPGELLLIRGADENGNYWQGVVEVATVVVQKKGATATPPPPPTDGTTPPECCEPDQMEAVIAARQLFLDKDLVADISLRRDFQGFGAPSLAVGELLPSQIDSTSNIDLGGGKVLFRDPELKAAVKVLGDWIMGAQ